jgi:hypothetical protein
MMPDEDGDDTAPVKQLVHTLDVVLEYVFAGQVDMALLLQLLPAKHATHLSNPKIPPPVFNTPIMKYAPPFRAQNLKYRACMFM